MDARINEKHPKLASRGHLGVGPWGHVEVYMGYPEAILALTWAILLASFKLIYVSPDNLKICEIFEKNGK